MSKADQFRDDLIRTVGTLQLLDPADSRVGTRVMRRLIKTALVELNEAERLEYAALKPGEVVLPW